jgi:hypothetical protein
MEPFAEPHAYNRLLVRTEAADRAEIERILTAVQDTVEAQGYPVLQLDIPTPGRSLRSGPLEAVMFVLTAIGLLTLCLAGFLVGNVMAAHGWAGQSSGILKAMEASGQIAGLYFRHSWSTDSAMISLVGRSLLG